MKVIPVQPDGNCFFSCIQKGLFPSKSPLDVRKEIVDYYLKQKKYQKIFDIDQNEIEKLYKDGCWDNDACDHIVKITSQKYNLVIRLYCPNLKKTFVIRPEKRNYFQKKQKTIHLRLLSNHYDLLLI